MSSSYEALFENNADVQTVFRKIPWALGGRIQEKDALIRCLLNEEKRLTEANGALKFSLITPLWNTDHRYIAELVASCRMQTYRNWELVLLDDGSQQLEHLPVVARLAAEDSRIKFHKEEVNEGISAARNKAIAKSSGDYICILDHDDILHPQILGIYARLLQEDASITMLYCNEVKVSDDLALLSEFCSKPDFCFSTLLRTNYICHFTAIKRSQLDAVRLSNGAIFRLDLDGVEDHDLFIRLAESPGFTARHVPVFGYYWRKASTSTASDIAVKPAIWETGVRMLTERLGDNANVVPKGGRGNNALYSIHYKPKGTTAIAVLVPYRDKPEMTVGCLEALEDQDYPNELKVFLIDNGSRLSTNAKIDAWLGEGRRHKYDKIEHDGVFNYSKINNVTVFQHCSSYDQLLFLNNDVSLRTKGAISAMVGELEHSPRTAVVGLRLTYPQSGALQHGGIGLRPNVHKLLTPTHISEDRVFVDDEHAAFAVTFACALVRADVFREVNGFNEEIFANGLSDVELCCRILESGRGIFYMGTLSGEHAESETRKHHVEDFEIMALNERYGGLLANQYLKQYGYDLVVPSGTSSDSWYEVPLRYKAVDRVNALLKPLMGPMHRAVRNLLKRSL